jgi:hypothetical protein
VGVAVEALQRLGVQDGAGAAGLEQPVDGFATLIAVNLQTAFLSPPVAMAAYDLKAVAPDWKLTDIYWDMAEFMVLQVVGLGLCIVCPESSGSLAGCTVPSRRHLGRAPVTSAGRPGPPAGAVDRVTAAIEAVSTVAGWLAGWLIVPMTLGVAYEVAARYVFNAPTRWASTATYTFYSAQFMLAAAYTLLKGGHTTARRGRSSPDAKAAH